MLKFYHHLTCRTRLPLCSRFISNNIDLICVLALLRQIALLVILCVEHIESKGVRFARLEIAIGLQFAVNILRDISNEPLRSISEIARFGIMNVRLPAELFCISMYKVFLCFPIRSHLHALHLWFFHKFPFTQQRIFPPLLNDEGLVKQITM